MRNILIVLVLIFLGGCKYKDEQSLVVNSIDSLLYSKLDEYVDENQYEKDLTSIRSEVDLKIDSIKAMLKTNATFDNNYFHVIVGSFSVDSNAKNYAQKMKNAGYEAMIIQKGRFKLVTMSSYNNLRLAINGLNKAKETVTSEAWLYISR